MFTSALEPSCSPGYLQVNALPGWRDGRSDAACRHVGAPDDLVCRASSSPQCCNLTPNSVLIRYFVPLIAERLHKHAQLLQTMLHIGPAS